MIKNKDSDNYKVCPECGSSNFVQDYVRGELVCSNCGLVITEQIVDNRAEWRAFDKSQNDKRSRVGMPMTYTIHDKGLSTLIDYRNKDAKGKDIKGKQRERLYRLRKWHRRLRITDATQRNLAFALSEIDRMASQLGLPKNVRERASLFYRKIVEMKLIRGRSMESVAAAALYAACRIANIPRTLPEIASVSKVNKKETARIYRFMIRQLDIRIKPTSPTEFVSRLSSKLNIPTDVEVLAIDIIKQAKKNGLTSGRGPTGIAAAALYIASILKNAQLTQKKIAETAQVTEVTVRNRYKELVNKLNLFPQLN